MRARRLPRRAVTPGAAALLAVCCGTALASWSTVGSGTGEASSGTLSAPTDVRPDGAGTVSWSRGATGDGAVPATDHLVQRARVSDPDDGSRVWTAACTSTATSCTDETLPAEPGRYLVVYRVVARFAAAWTAASAESAATWVTVEPELAVSAPDLAAGSDTGESSTDDLTRAQVLTLTGTATDGALVEVLDGTTVVASATATGGGWTVTTAPLAGGTGTTHTLRARASLEGATATSGSLLVTIDTVAPEVGPVAVAANGTSSNAKALSGTASTAVQHPGALATVTLSVVDGSPGARCSLSSTSAPVNPSSGAWSGPTVSLERGAGCTVTAVQQDTAGNSRSVSATVTRS